MQAVNVICYETKKPVIYNKGTIYEKSCRVFLACGGVGGEEKNRAYVDMLNSNEVEARQFCERLRLDYDNIKCFYHHQQETFDTRGN
jgi:hypothetical protein